MQFLLVSSFRYWLQPSFCNLLENLPILIGKRICKYFLSTGQEDDLVQMRILISGAGGLIGRCLDMSLEKEGHEVVRLIRANGKSYKRSVVWDPSVDQIDLSALENFDCVFHLAGKNTTEKRWTDQVKKGLFQSRCRDTWLLCQAFNRTKTKPKIVITASAIGYYGDRGDDELDESASQGKGFLADLCAHWERATEVIEHNGTRVVHARFGVIMTPEGGMLGKLKLPFRLGLGAVLGSGQQWMSWVSIDDAIRALKFMMEAVHLSGPVNICTPAPVRNEEFTYLLAKALHRKAYLRIPRAILRLLLGEIAEEMLLSSTKATPAKLLHTGFCFEHPSLQQLFRVFGWN